jgi:hypothetical protein
MDERPDDAIWSGPAAAESFETGHLTATGPLRDEEPGKLRTHGAHDH